MRRWRGARTAHKTTTATSLTSGGGGGRQRIPLAGAAVSLSR
ncbi:hypothetical protein ACFPRL_04740 [Pseudoclavibacter helvolus]